MSYIEFDKVSFEYPGGFLAIDNIELKINKGASIAIVGQNGAGKTTTVKMLNGLLKPTTGNVLIDKMNTKNYTVAEMSRKAGYVFQNPDDQIFHSRIYDEVAFGTKILNKSKAETEKIVKDALEITNLTHLKDENPFDLPISMRKFVSIASIIAMDTEVMIFDEPTAGQDLSGNRQLAFLLKHLQKKGKTLVTISHDMEFVANNFKQIIVMANKRIVTTGSPSEVFWDTEALEEAMLKQPYSSRICKKLNLGKGNVTMDETIGAILRKSKETRI